METLPRDTETLPQPEPDGEGPLPPAAAASGAGGDDGGGEVDAARACTGCGAGLAPEQDWCLVCGTARPGRLGARPGWRAATTVAGLTVTLVLGAVGASWAAIADDANQQAARPATVAGTPVAQLPPSIPGPVASTPAASTPAPRAPLAAATTPLSLPPVAPTPTPTPTPSPTPTPTPSAGSGSSTSSGSSTTSTSTTSSGSDGTPTAPTAPPTPIALDPSAAQVYDPYARAVQPGDPGAALDSGDGAFSISTPSDGKPMQVGLLVDLGERKLVRALRFATTTPGFRLEVYGTDGSALPPDILDTRWTHVASRAKVDRDSIADNVSGDGKERIDLPAGGDRFRYVVLWFTKAPPDAPTVDVADLRLLG